jgi:hypothetical protein
MASNDNPLASAWAWIGALVLVNAIGVYMGWPFWVI